MKNFFSTVGSRIRKGAISLRTFIVKRKITSAIIVLILLGGGYYAYTAMAANSAGTEYVLSTVTRGPLLVTVTGSGEVDAKDTLNVTPQGSASGQITKLDVTPGQTVKAGQVIAELDMTTAAQAVTTARQNLESAEISYKQTQSSSGTSVTSDQASITTDEGTAATALATNYTDLPTVMNGLDGILHNLSTISDYTAEENIDAYRNLVNSSESQTYNVQVQNDYSAALASYQNTKAEYANTNVSTLTPAQIQQLDTDTIKTDVLVETALKDTLSYYQYINQELTSAKYALPTQLATQIASLTAYQTTVTSDGSTINNTATSLTNAEQSLVLDTQSTGVSNQPLTVQSAELNVQKAQESLSEALTTESDYVVRAPFDGVIGTVPVNAYDQASSGTTIATLITTEEYADLSLNEADAAKISVGQPATITFDALPSVTMPGSVAIVNPVGTVSQGVTTYDVKISFAQQNSQVKPGMTAEAVITTASSTNALQVPSAAVTTNGNFSTIKVATLIDASSTLAKLSANGSGSAGSSYTHRSRTASSTNATSSSTASGTFGGYGGGNFASSTGGVGSSTRGAYGALGMSGTTAMTSRSLTVPASEVTIKTVTVSTGLSNDTMTEITSGLMPGEYVVTATQSAATTKKSTATSATSLLGGSTSRTGLGGATGGGYTGARTGGTGGAAAGGGSARGGGG
jgi:HlyD family secretion protein